MARTQDSTAMHGTADMGSRCWQSTCVCGLSHPTVSMFITCRLRDREASRHSGWMQLAPATRSSALVSPPASSCSMTHYFSQGLHITCEAPLKGTRLAPGRKLRPVSNLVGNYRGQTWIACCSLMPGCTAGRLLVHRASAMPACHCHDAINPTGWLLQTHTAACTVHTARSSRH